MRIGIPRSFYYYAYPGLWESYFSGLGFEVVVSDRTSRQTLELAAAVTESEHCLPHKIFDGHVRSLLDRVDAVFIPRIISMTKGHICCPRFGALPDGTQARIACGHKIITLEINETVESLERSLLRLSRELGCCGRVAKQAIVKAMFAWKSQEEAELRRKQALGATQRYLLLGHPYTLHDDYIVGPVASKLKQLGVCVELMSFERQELKPDFIRWCSFHKMYHKLLDLDLGLYAGVVQLTTFNCGADSMMTERFRRICRRNGIPYLLLMLDEHTGRAGIDTRIEAFVDSLQWKINRDTQASHTSQRVGSKSSVCYQRDIIASSAAQACRRISSASGRGWDAGERLAIPNLGNYTVALASAVRSLGIEAWWSTATDTQAMELGKAVAPESLCLPFKAHLGHFIAADDAGVENALMVNSVGTCRLRYYRGMIEEILRDMGRKIRVWGLGFDGFKPPLIRHFDPPLWPFVRAVLLAIEKIKVIDTLETAVAYTRAREAHIGTTSQLMERCLAELAQIDTKREVKLYHQSLKALFADIELDQQRDPLRIGLIGEVSVLRDKLLNQNLEQTLGHLGVEIKNFFLLGAELGNIFGLPFGNRQNTRKHLAVVAKPYLGCAVGGHALDSVAHTITCAQQGYDAMVHVCPAGCMPEISIRPILWRISRDMDIPVLQLSFDEHTSPVGVLTRVEAFIDMLQVRRRRGIKPQTKMGQI